MEGAAPPRVVRAADRPAFSGEGGIGIAEVDGGIPRDLCIVEATALPGERTGLHSHPGDEHHVVLRGHFRLVQGDHVVELGPGDYMLWDATIPHDAENIGDEPATMLIISARNPRGETARPDPTSDR